MNRIDRYTLSLFWFYCIAGLMVIVTMFIAVQAMSDLVDYKGVALHSFIRYYGYSLPETLQKMLPVACLIGSVFTLNSLQKNNEMTPLFAAGMSLFRIMLPTLLSVIFLCILNLYLTDRILPPLAKQKHRVFQHEIKKLPSVISMNKVWYRSRNAIFYIKTLNLEGSKAQGLNLYFFDESFNLLQMMTAKEVELNGPQWTLFDGTITLFSKETSFPLTDNFKKKVVVMSEDSSDLQSSRQTSEMLTQGQLKQFIDKNREAGLETTSYEVDYHSKFSFAFAGLIMTLLSIPVSVGRARSGGMMVNAGICLGLVFVYWVLYNSALTLGNRGHIEPFFAAWITNVAGGALSAVLFIKLRR